MTILEIIVAATAVCAALLTGVLRRYALRSGLIDRPNERSSHSTPTPRGGGLAIVVTSLAAIAVLWWLQVLSGAQFAAFAGGLAVAIVGFIDDRRSVRPVVRLAVHLAAAVWAVAWFGGLAGLQVGSHVVSLGWLGYGLAVLGIVWALNLFNFMDGIDGIAASESGFITGCGALLVSLNAGAAPAAAAGWVMCAASLGFLLWNWPPARIFMGDVGSGYLGYMIAVLAMAANREDPVAIWIWLLLGGVFFVDATFTLIRRSARGERVHEAHRSHAYQWLARRWGRHLPVTLSALAINILWLLPAAWLVETHRPLAVWIVAGAYVPLIVLAALAGAGRAERF